MLYHQWLETARTFARDPALFDGDAAVTFGELAAAAAKAPPAAGPLVARAGGLAFFTEILRAWRDGQAVIPIERDAPEPRLVRTPPGEIRLVKHTPGAAGVPRGIFLNATQVAADAARIVAAMGLRPGEPNLAVLSLAHSYGFSSIVLPMLLHGVPLRLVAAPFPRVVEEAMARHASVVLPAVPPMWRAWQRSGMLRGAPVRLAISAGSPLPLELEHDVFTDCGLKIHNFYGASECGAIAFDFLETPRDAAGLVGSQLPGVDVCIDSRARLVVRSDAVACGYETVRPDDLLGGGIYRTRDTGRFDSGGLLHLTGTTGGAINVAGRKVSPARVEAAILGTGLVRSASVSGIPSADPERHEEILARVELLGGATLGDLRGRLGTLLPPWETPRHWQIGPPGKERA